MAAVEPSAHHVHDAGSTRISPGIWCVDPDEAIDAAFAFVPPGEWGKAAGLARALPMARFGDLHAPAPGELLFFCGLAGENVGYLGSFGADLIVSGYCSQEKAGSGDDGILEILCEPGGTAVTSGTDPDIRDRVRHADLRGFSGSLVWNTRFVEAGCDPSSWRPDAAVVTGLLRRYGPSTTTLLAWRVEHLSAWLRQSSQALG